MIALIINYLLLLTTVTEPTMTSAASSRPAFIPSLAYKDNRAALAWLEKAFGFEPSEILSDAAGNIVHAEMTYGDGVVMIGSEWADSTRSSRLSGRQEHSTRPRTDRARHRRALRPGTSGRREDRDGARGPVLRCPYLHRHRSGRSLLDLRPTVRDVSMEDMEEASGFRFERPS